MKKIYISILLIMMFFLSSCISTQRFEFETAQVRNSEDIITILDYMMIQGDHDNTTVILHNLIYGSLNYTKGKIVLNQITYNVFEKTRNQKSVFQNMQCINQQNGKLACTEKNLIFQLDEQYETITLGEAKQFLSKIDFPKLLPILEKDNDIIEYDSMYVVFIFESFRNKIVTLGKEVSSSTLLINDSLVSAGEVTLDGVIMRLQIVYAKAEDAQVFQIYVEN